MGLGPLEGLSGLGQSPRTHVMKEGTSFQDPTDAGFKIRALLGLGSAVAHWDPAETFLGEVPDPAPGEEEPCGGLGPRL